MRRSAWCPSRRAPAFESTPLGPDDDGPAVLSPETSPFRQLVVALLVAANFIGAYRVLQGAEFLGKGADKFIRWCAEHTFTLYLFHFPMLYFTAAWSPWQPTDLRHALLLLGVTLLSVVLFAKVGESRKREWRRLMLWLWNQTYRVRQWLWPRTA